MEIHSSRSNSSRNSPYDILDIEEDATPETIKKKYRQLSLCEELDRSFTLKQEAHLHATLLVIHPDKTSHERAPEAFDLLKKVQKFYDHSSFQLTFTYAGRIRAK